MSDELLIKATEDTPEINFSSLTGVLQISGRSLPEDAFSFYEPVQNWLTSYALTFPEQTNALIKLEYFNTASAKQIFKILQTLCQLSKQKPVKVKWFYDVGDKDMLASGQRFSKLCGVDLEFCVNG